MAEKGVPQLKAIHPPKISLWNFKRSYVKSEGVAVLIGECSTKAFKEALLPLSLPRVWDQGTGSCLLTLAEIDLYERWYICNRLLELGYPLKLYAWSEVVQ